MRPHAPHGPTDTILARLYEAIDVPRTISGMRAFVTPLLPRVEVHSHRVYLEAMMEEIERARYSDLELSRLGRELEH